MFACNFATQAQAPQRACSMRGTESTVPLVSSRRALLPYHRRESAGEGSWVMSSQEVAPPRSSVRLVVTPRGGARQSFARCCYNTPPRPLCVATRCSHGRGRSRRRGADGGRTRAGPLSAHRKHQARASRRAASPSLLRHARRCRLQLASAQPLRPRRCVCVLTSSALLAAAEL